MRRAKLRQYKAVWLTKKSYGILREKKRELKKSMMEIIDSLIKNNYGKDKDKK